MNSEGERREPATQRRREQARQRGQVARSGELSSAVLILGIAGLLSLAGGRAAETLARFAARTWAGPWRDWGIGELPGMLRDAVEVWIPAAFPFLAAGVGIGAASQLVQGGFLFSARPLAPVWDRLNPLSGARRLFSRRSLVETAKALLKIVLVGTAAYGLLRNRQEEALHLAQTSPAVSAAWAWAVTKQLVFRVGFVLLGIGALDYLFRRWEMEQGLRMTREEVKEEYKETEGQPQVRSRVRRRQREMARVRHLAAVRDADVVVVNPVHYAVALRYDESTMDAPLVLAKGKGYLAVLIRRLAGIHRVPVVAEQALARALYASTEVGTAIPVDLYQAVAEVLAFIYKIGQRAGMRARGGRIAKLTGGHIARPTGGRADLRTSMRAGTERRRDS
ncbi:MAG: EscU/YscU/HrcU family type III secretion system export apparatus switch protein [Firmicutes bacterium]|nr:EscU/YscU/HrcU family type III secretion system export apparatus switch protein [Bacillota bacterium]